MASIGLETYRVVQDFTAREGDYVIVVNGLCVGVDGGAGASKVVGSVRKTVNGYTYSPRAANQPSSDEVMRFIRDRIPASETFSTHEVSKRMGLSTGKHDNVSTAIQRLRDAGEIEKVPNAKAHGPYIKVRIATLPAPAP